MIRSIKKNSGGPRGKGIVLPAPKPIDAPPLHAKRDSVSPSVYHPPELKKYRWKRRTEEEKEKEGSWKEKIRIGFLERKWRAVAAYCQRQSMFGGYISN
jgi:hypothetical protein